MPPTELPPTKDRPLIPTLRRFLPYLWPADAPGLKIRIVIAMTFVVLSKVVQVYVTAYALRYAVNAMSGRNDWGVGNVPQFVMLMVIGYAAGRLSGVVFDNLRNVVFERVGQEATRQLAATVFRHLHRLSLRFHLERRTGAVTKVVERGTKSIDTMLYFLLFNIAPTLLELCFVMQIFWSNFGLWLDVATLVMIVVYIGFTRIVTDWRNALRTRMNDLDTGAVAHAVDSLLNFETVKYFGAEEREARRYEAAVGAYANAAVKSENSLAWLNIGQALVTNLMLGGGMVFIAWGWAHGRFSPGDVVFVSTLLTQLFRPLDLLGMVYRTIRQGVVDMAAMFDLLDTGAEIVDAPGALPLNIDRGHIRFEDVHFGYEPGRDILKGIDLDIPAGKTLAVVGPSGAGKSTLARLMYRFYDLTGGRVTIDGQDISKVTQASLRAAIGIVPQDTVLFNDTIGYNIAYGREGAGEEEIVRAAKGAAISGFIERQPDQYETRVGERGLKLSGGEKQRVAIARTLLKNPPIMIFDEATSALDSANERAIQAELKGVAQNKTALVIAHRLSTIIDADEILVLEHGRVVERGTHVALLGANGVYARMWRLQQDERREASPPPADSAEEATVGPAEPLDVNPAPAAAAAATLRSAS